MKFHDIRDKSKTIVQSRNTTVATSPGMFDQIKSATIEPQSVRNFKANIKPKARIKGLATDQSTDMCFPVARQSDQTNQFK